MQNDGYNNRVNLDTGRNPSQVSRHSHNMPAFGEILKTTDGTHSPMATNSPEEFISKMVEKIGNSQQQDRSSEIPSLDLGSQILAQQRKIAALKRKSPVQNDDSSVNKQQVQSKPPQVRSMPPAPPSPQQKIIADIVAKEIFALSAAR